jgi:hypothetical protein
MALVLQKRLHGYIHPSVISKVGPGTINLDRKPALLLSHGCGIMHVEILVPIARRSRPESIPARFDGAARQELRSACIVGPCMNVIIDGQHSLRCLNDEEQCLILKQVSRRGGGDASECQIRNVQTRV